LIFRDFSMDCSFELYVDILLSISNLSCQVMNTAVRNRRS
jgi:hypothetical protein